MYHPRFSELIFKTSIRGDEMPAAADPVIAKTIKIFVSWKLEDIPHFVFNFLNIYPSNLII